MMAPFFLVATLLFLTSCQTPHTQTSTSSRSESSGPLDTSETSLSTTEQINSSIIYLTINQTELVVELNQTETAQDLLALLPLTLSVTKWGDIEYYGRLDEPLSTNSPLTDEFTSGDVMYDPSTQNLALFYDTKTGAEITDFINIGTIVSDLALFDEFDNNEELTITEITAN